MTNAILDSHVRREAKPRAALEPATLVQVEQGGTVIILDSLQPWATSRRPGQTDLILVTDVHDDHMDSAD